MNDSTIEVGDSSLAIALEMGGIGYKIVPIPPGEKFPKGLPKWQERATNDELQIQQWWGQGERGIGWAMGKQPNGMNLVAVDVDVAGGKQGKANFTAFVKEHDLSGAVASTVTSHTGGGGYHFVFELPADVEMTNGILCEGVDIRGEGGFIVVPPSIHPNGKPYRWHVGKEPWTMAAAPCPEAIIAALTADSVEEAPESPPRLTLIDDDLTPADWVRANMEIGRLLAQQGWSYMENKGTDQYWCRPGKLPRDGHSAIVHENGAGPMVIWSTSAPAEFWRVGRDSRDASRTLSVFEVYAAVEHHGDIRRAASFVRRNLMSRETGRETALPVSTVRVPEEVGPPVAQNLPDEFWESRPWLAHIRQAAHARQVSADSILGAVLTRYATIIPPTYQIPPIIMTASTFDHISVLVAESSLGKSGAMGIARELFPGPQDRKDVVWDFPTPSGEGLVSAFFEMVTEDEGGKKVQVNKKTKTAVHFSVDEALGLVEASGRQGATIGSVLCTAWSGGNPGQGNASADRRRVGMNPHTYRMSGLAAIQLSLGHRLLDDVFVQQGLSGRLVFFAAEDQTIIHWKERPEWPGELKLPTHPTVPTNIEYDKAIEDEILEQNWLKQTKQSHIAPIDGHLNLVKMKLSGILALMDGRQNVTLSDWHLAGMVISSHLSLRNRMISIKKQDTHERSVTAATAAAYFESTKDDVKERQAIASLRDTIIARIPEEGITRGKLRKKVTNTRTRHRFDEALLHAMQDGKLVERDGSVHKS